MKKKKEQEQPIRVIKVKGRHKTEIRVFSREIHDHLCIQTGCRFKDRPAQQGVCHSDKGWLIDFDRLDQHEKDAQNELEMVKKKYYKGRGEDYMRWLEAMYISVSMNFTGTLDDLVRLRRDNAILKDKLAKTKKAT